MYPSKRQTETLQRGRPSEDPAELKDMLIHQRMLQAKELPKLEEERKETSWVSQLFITVSK
jgi:hypothetical protein